MAKIYGLFGAMTGKVADVVMSVRNGEQIARKYQPIVSNPSTPAQIATRAIMKSLSQLAAVMAPVIAIPRTGAVSSRNKFIKVNYPTASYASDTATIDMLNVQLTKSVVSFPALKAVRSENAILVSIENTDRIGTLDVDRVVYCMFIRTSDNVLRYIGSAVSTEAGVDNSWPASLPLANTSLVIYAYGVRDNTEAARVIFGNLAVPTAAEIASLIVTRNLTEVDVTLTETRSIALQPVA